MKWNERFPSLSGVLIQSSCTSDGSYRHAVASRSHLFIMNTRRKRRSGSPLITYACGVTDKDADTVLSVCGNERQPARHPSASANRRGHDGAAGQEATDDQVPDFVPKLC